MTVEIVAAVLVPQLARLLKTGMEEVAKTSFKDVYQSIRSKFAAQGKAEVIDKFEQNPDDQRGEMEQELVRLLKSAPDLTQQVREAIEHANAAGTINVEKVSGKNVVIANNAGDITFNN